MSKISSASGLEAPFIGVFPQPIVSSRNPTANDINYPLGTLWVNKSANTVWAISSVVAGQATWGMMSPGTSEVDSLTPDSGTSPVTPSAGTITIAGGTNINTVGSSGTVTLNLNDAISLATSVTSPLYTTSGSDMAITSDSGFNINITLGDAAGAQDLNVLDSSSGNLMSLDSTGNLTVKTSIVNPLYTASGVDLAITADTGKDVIITMGDAAGSNIVDFENSSSASVASVDSLGNIGISGNASLNGAGTQLQVKGGAVTDFIGTATLVLGTATVLNTNIATTDKIFLTRRDPALSTTLGELSISAITASTSFVITSLIIGTPGSPQTGDLSVLDYFIVRQI